MRRNPNRAFLVDELNSPSSALASRGSPWRITPCRSTRRSARSARWKTSAKATVRFVYFTIFPDGSQRTYTSAEFANTSNWKNDPEKATMLQLEE